MAAATWPLTGRAEELRLISGLTRRRDGPAGVVLAGVVLAGAAGVGKTRLAREALAMAEKRGALIRWAAATASARGQPLGAFAATLGVVGPDPARLVRQASDALLAGAGRAGVIIGVDDAHLLDELSAMLVHQLALRRAATVVLTLRSGETAPDAVTALWKDGHLTRLELQPLSEAETATLVEAALGGPLDSAAARRLWTTTRGNALYLRQLVDGELESSRLRQVAGVWRWSGELALSPGLAELVSARIGQLPDSMSDVIEVLAFGEPLSVPLLAGLTDAAAVEAAEARGLVEVYPDGRRLQVRLAHPLFGEVQREQMGRLRARRLRGRIARALATTGARRADDTLRRAMLALDSDLEPDSVLLTHAASRATELGNLALAGQIARAAVAAGGGFESRLLLGNALTWSGRGAEADTELAALGSLARCDAERAQAAIPRVVALALGLGLPAEAEAMLDAVASSISDDTVALELAGMRSFLDAYLGRTVQAAEVAAGVLAHPGCSSPAAQLATWGLAVSCGGLGRLDGLDERVQQIDARADAFETGLHQAAVIGAAWLRGLLLAGLLDQADHASQRYRERCQDTPGPGYVSTSGMCGEVAKSRGQVQTAARWLRQALAGLRGTDTGGWSFQLLVHLTAALGMAGDATSAREALVGMTAARHPAIVYREPDVLLAEAWVAAAEGSVSEAVTRARQAAELAASQDQPAVEVFALHTAVCLGDRTVADRLAELATQVDGPLAPAAAAHAAALATDDGAALHAASVQFEQIGALLLAADAAAQAAAAHTRHDRRGSAQASTTRAHRLAGACEGARTPALAALVAPLALTNREREIVTLAAGGLSNRQIAERLVVSVRTVEGHLYRACTKLGTSDRAGLAAVLRGD
ncbi:MAG TPA: LuxR C-terminal-related transcriptional regulator [Pseudonocardiaceae bacterium]|nr:LuxR C-terminal-related transcriptional regulator [Pseudonocardiaceae bacterium]